MPRSPQLPPHMLEELRRDMPPASFLFFFDDKEKEGIAACETWIETSPQDPKAYAARASMHAVHGQPNLAILFYNHAIHLDPQEAMYVLSRARAHLAARRPADAIPDLERVIEVDRAGKEFGYFPHLLLADCLRRLNRTREALTLCDRIPDDYIFPGFLGLRNGSKFSVIDRINKAPFTEQGEDEE